MRGNHPNEVTIPQTKGRGQYTQDFRDSAVQLALNGEKTVLQISEDLGVNSKTLYNWIRIYKQKNNIPIAPRGYATSISKKQNLAKETIEDELNMLRKENRILKQEREILKKAAAYFAKETL